MRDMMLLLRSHYYDLVAVPCSHQLLVPYSVWSGVDMEGPMRRTQTMHAIVAQAVKSRLRQSKQS